MNTWKYLISSPFTDNLQSKAARWWWWLRQLPPRHCRILIAVELQQPTTAWLAFHARPTSLHDMHRARWKFCFIILSLLLLASAGFHKTLVMTSLKCELKTQNEKVVTSMTSVINLSIRRNKSKKKNGWSRISTRSAFRDKVMSIVYGKWISR